MDCRILAMLFGVLVILAWMEGGITEGRHKKVVIHVPFKVKKIKHTHTIYKTVHHHHHDPAQVMASEDHEHFHHVHVHDEVPAAAQPVPGIGIPEFLPDVPIEEFQEQEQQDQEIRVMPTRHFPLPRYIGRHM